MTKAKKKPPKKKPAAKKKVAVTIKSEIVDQAPDGYHWEWLPDGEWLVGGGGRTCSMLRCHNPAVAQLARPRHRGELILVAWFAYCSSHLYGRKIEDGVVKFRRLVKDEAEVMATARVNQQPHQRMTKAEAARKLARLVEEDMDRKGLSENKKNAKVQQFVEHVDTVSTPTLAWFRIGIVCFLGSTLIKRWSRQIASACYSVSALWGTPASKNAPAERALSSRFP